MTRPRFPARLAKWQFSLRFICLLEALGCFILWIMMTTGRGDFRVHSLVGVLVAIAIDSSECITLFNKSRSCRRLPNPLLLCGDGLVMLVLGWGMEVSEYTLAMAEKDNGVWDWTVSYYMSFGLICSRAILFIVYGVIAFRQRNRHAKARAAEAETLPFAKLEPMDTADSSASTRSATSNPAADVEIEARHKIEVDAAHRNEMEASQKNEMDAVHVIELEAASLPTPAPPRDKPPTGAGFRPLSIQETPVQAYAGSDIR